VIASRLFAARWVLPITAPPIADGAVLVDRDGAHRLVGPRAEAPAAEAIETLGDVILLPGLVDAHTHLELTAMRGLLEQASFFDWIRTLTRARAEVLADDDLLDAARLGVCEGLAAGVTTFADTSASGAPVLEALVALGRPRRRLPGGVRPGPGAARGRPRRPPAPGRRAPRAARRGERRRPRPRRREPPRRLLGARGPPPRRLRVGRGRGAPGRRCT
jgi:imidazolonepropionase-like amidohydrolase